MCLASSSNLTCVYYTFYVSPGYRNRNNRNKKKRNTKIGNGMISYQPCQPSREDSKSSSSAPWMTRQMGMKGDLFASLA